VLVPYLIFRASATLGGRELPQYRELNLDIERPSIDGDGKLQLKGIGALVLAH
jgi:hypothetical protein